MVNKLITDNVSGKGVYSVFNGENRLLKRAVRKTLALRLAKEYVKKSKNRVAYITKNNFIIYNK